MSDSSFYVTTPIYYPNGKPHMGHAYTSVLCDVLVRYHRLIGEDTYLLTGVDENASKIGEAAEAAGKSVAEFTDGQAEVFKAFYQGLGVGLNRFVRTTDTDTHWKAATEMWERLEKAGAIYKGTYAGLYCTGCESYKTDKELDDKGNCPDHGRPPTTISEENYFFKLSAYADEIKEHIKSGTFRIEPESRRNEILAVIESGLEDVSFSRPKEVVPHAIPVPNDPSHVMYVWCDALVSYISGLGFGTDDTTVFDRFWPAQYHVIGKDILRFHTAIWPGMLLAAGIPLPKAVFVHGMIISDGAKMSKTIGNVLDPQDFVNEFGTDALRYYLSRHISPVQDSDMTRASFVESYNANLANGIGNLTSRIMKMIDNYNINIEDMTFPSVHEVLDGDDVSEYHAAFRDNRVDKAADVVWGLMSFMDNYIQETKPFTTIKEDPEQATEDLLFLVERLYEVAILLRPFMPETAAKIEAAIEDGKALETALFQRTE